MGTAQLLLTDTGEGLEEAVIVRWLVQVGQTVQRDESVVEVETEKAVVELPSPATGTVHELHVEEGDSVVVGAPLMTLAVAEEQPGSATRPETGDAYAFSSAGPDVGRDGIPMPNASTSETPSSRPDSEHPRLGRRRVLAEPAARKLANEFDIDISTVPGSGPGGRVTRQDVEGFVERGEDEDHGPAVQVSGRPAYTTQPLRGIRKQIARNLARSWQEIPHITAMRLLPALDLVEARGALRSRLEKADQPFSYLPIFIHAVARTLVEHPRLNSMIDMDESVIHEHTSVNMGVATATQDGLVVVVIRDADRRSVDDIFEELHRLVRAAHDRSIRMQDLSAGTFTVSNTGSYGGWFGTPIIRPPEVAIAAFGRIYDAVVAETGKPVVRPVLPLSIAADHRLVDGSHLGAFINDLSDRLSRASELV